MSSTSFSLERETWTSRSGNAVEAAIVGFYAPWVFLKTKSKGMINIPYAALDDSCQQRTLLWMQADLGEKAAESQMVEDSDSKLTLFLKDRLVKHTANGFESYDFSTRKRPDFYAFYFSAHCSLVSSVSSFYP